MIINEPILLSDLDSNPEVLTEAIQTILRKNGFSNAYEIMKEMARGKQVSIDDIYSFIKTLGIPESDKNILLNLTPNNYTGLASNLVDFI